ncbi:MAG: tetratricopeptide repeat protein [Treponemataceae bacterium]|nr:tetratricopeptide repeat protein [Treponemataceae bacterium]HOJ99991.1 tetratricopeptide repeat protein [Termitinemataceae bacterium]HOM22990.1 tetratricopeptide repeat protein [Termitinemataceae bacterium]HPQ00471.1 tetratricopeptide repeat protein [Termitinemataceae bacterium]
MWKLIVQFFRMLFKKKEDDPDQIKEEVWTTDLSHPGKGRFIPEESTKYRGSYTKQGFTLELHHEHTLTWIEDPLYRYQDLFIQLDVHFSTPTAYYAGGLQFHRVDDSSYYSLLVSNRGYFRLDLLFNGRTMPLIGWTEIPRSQGKEASGKTQQRFQAETSIQENPAASPGGLSDPITAVQIGLIVSGERMCILINNRWAAEIQDATIPEGRLTLLGVLYEKPGAPLQSASLLFRHLHVDSRPLNVEAYYIRWTSFIPISPTARYNLAETFFVMNQPHAALVQLKRLWKERPGPRTASELLLAGRSALLLGLHQEAEEYFDHCIEVDSQAEEARQALAEKAKILYLQDRYGELIELTREALGFFPQDPVLHTLQAHGAFQLGLYEEALSSYQEAFQKDNDNGLLAQNIGSTFEKLGNPEEALRWYCRAGKLFLHQEQYHDMELLIPRLQELGSSSAEAHGIIGKYFFAVEEYPKAQHELERAHTLNAQEDAAVPYLLALISIQQGHRKKALSLLEEAIALDSAVATFHFRLAESRFILYGSAHDEKTLYHLEEALRLDPGNGWIHNLAAQIAMAKGDLSTARIHLEKARDLLGEELPLIINQAELLYLQGEPAQALDLVSRYEPEDTTGEAAHEKGTILYRLGRFEEADWAFQEALKKNPHAIEYQLSRAHLLIDMGLYGEADDILADAYETEGKEPYLSRILDLIGYVATKKGEFPRAEVAYRLAIEAAPEEVHLYQELAWLYLTMGRWQQTRELIDKLKALRNKDDTELEAAIRALEEQYLESTTEKVACSVCQRLWRVPRQLPPVPPLKLVAQPPENLPAGMCPSCGKIYCIQCAKEHLDTGGRFLCPTCQQHLKLIDDRLRYLLYEWSRQSEIAKNINF